MSKQNNVTNSNVKLNTFDMLSELPIGIVQLRNYIKDGRLKAKKNSQQILHNKKRF